MSLTFQILRELADGKFHSGEQLAQKFNISRARIWQSVAELRQLGLEVAAVTGRGYKIFDGVELLDKNKIISELPAHMTENIDIMIYPQTESTNSVLVEGLRQKAINPGTVCLAEHQSQGRGRLGRTWESPLCSNIYCSLAWQFNLGAAQLMGLSLVAGLAVAKALNQIGARNIGLKWPNDIFWEGKKLGGILVEVAGDALGPCDVVIGIGLNVNMPRHIKIDQAFTDLTRVCQRSVSRNQLISYLITALYDYLPRFSSEGLVPLLDEWAQYDILQNQAIRITQQDEIQEGVAMGINKHGQLKVNINGTEQLLTSAQVSVRVSD